MSAQGQLCIGSEMIEQASIPVTVAESTINTTPVQIYISGIQKVLEEYAAKMDEIVAVTESYVQLLQQDLKRIGTGVGYIHDADAKMIQP